MKYNKLMSRDVIRLGPRLVHPNCCICTVRVIGTHTQLIEPSVRGSRFLSAGAFAKWGGSKHACMWARSRLLLCGGVSNARLGVYLVELMDWNT